jgi:hypothetical protein
MLEFGPLRRPSPPFAGAFPPTLFGLALLLLVMQTGCTSTTHLERLKADERKRLVNTCVKDVRYREHATWKRYGNPADLQTACWRYANAALP